jgi:hypothetical protein
MVEWLALLLRIREMTFQMSVRRPAILTEVFVLFISPSRQIPRQCLKLGYDRFFHILSNSLFTTILAFYAI